MHLDPIRSEAERISADRQPASGIVRRREGLAGVPRLAISMATLMALPLDHRTGFIMSFVDGTYSIQMILDACAMKPDEALGILSDLMAKGIIELE
jgi:hypothetical protein